MPKTSRCVRFRRSNREYFSGHDVFGREDNYVFRLSVRAVIRSNRKNFKTSTPPGFDFRTDQTIVSPYTDCAITAHNLGVDEQNTG